MVPVETLFPNEWAMRPQIVEFVRTHPGCTYAEISANMGASDEQGLMATIHAMVDDGTLVSDGSARTRYDLSGIPGGEGQ